MLMSSSKRLYEEDSAQNGQEVQSPREGNGLNSLVQWNHQDIFFRSRGESNIADSVIQGVTGSEHNIDVKCSKDQKEPRQQFASDKQLSSSYKLLGKRSRDDRESSISPRNCKGFKSDQSGHTGQTTCASNQPEIHQLGELDGDQNIESLFNMGHCDNQSYNSKPCKQNELKMTQMGSFNNDVTSSNGSQDLSNPSSVTYSAIEIGVFNLISQIKNPDDNAHSLGVSQIVKQSYISSDEFDQERIEFGCPITIKVQFKPLTVFAANTHFIGLAIRAKLNLILPQDSFKLDVFVLEDSHVNKFAIDRQINDKERVSAAFENSEIWTSILDMIQSS